MAPKRKAQTAQAENRKKARTETTERSETSSTRAMRSRPDQSVSQLPSEKELKSSRRSGTPKTTKSRDSQVSKKAAKEVRGLKSDELKDTKTKSSPKAQQKAKIVQRESRSDDKEEEDRGGRQYWLMKAEPEDRYENGINVKFSIDDLEAASSPEPWDGVRNYVARNNMRLMKEGDLAFFYHSNCAVPGIVGIMRIVQEHTIDESAFDPKHPYYDQKSQRDKPKWELVHVGFVKKFNEKISLKAIQQKAASTKELSEMDLLKYKRLSVTNVKPNEWDFIIQWAGEPANIGETGE